MHSGQLVAKASLGALLFGALLVTACTASSGPGTQASPDGNVTPFVNLIPGDGGDLSANAPAFQKAILKDGKVTFEEYQKSVFATVQCAKEHGIKFLQEPTLGPGRKYTFQMSGGTTEIGLDSINSVYNACYTKYERLIDIAWTYETRPTQEQLNKASAALAACLRKVGTTLPAGPSSADFRGAQESNPSGFQTCSDTVSKQFDIQDFVG